MQDSRIINVYVVVVWPSDLNTIEALSARQQRTHLSLQYQEVGTVRGKEMTCFHSCSSYAFLKEVGRRIVELMLWAMEGNLPQGTNQDE